MKRTFDIVVSIIAIGVSSPLLLLIYLVISITSRGPAIFKQERVGLNGETFTIWKFRTMKWQPDAPFERCTGLRDPRIVWGIGHLLRLTKLDEFPQFFNVLAGSMSVFGPRPYETSMDRHYAATVPGYTARYSVKPGVVSPSKLLSRRDIDAEVRLDTERYEDSTTTTIAATSRQPGRFAMNTATVATPTTVEEAKLARSQHRLFSGGWWDAHELVRKLRNAAWDAFGHGVEGRRDREAY